MARRAAPLVPRAVLRVAPAVQVARETRVVDPAAADF
jgi:hypothetical protein